jgi:hypothetical protein
VGATASDTQREIEEIRKDVTSAVGELNRRLRGMTDVRAHVKRANENPAALLGIGLTAVGVAGVVGARAIVESRRRQRPSERLRRTMLSAAEELGERWERAREALPLELHVGGREDDDGRGRPVQIAQREPSMIKKVLWAALAATMMAGAGLLARRLSAVVWRAAMAEDPPTAKV